MSANPKNTWELQLADGGAHRPTLEDVGGASYADDTNDPPPRGPQSPYADQLNQVQYQTFAVAQTTPSARFTIDYAAGEPFIDRLETCSSLLSPADFAIERTPGGAGAGDVTIDWLTYKLPPLVVEPSASINDVTKLTANAPLVHIVTSGVSAGHSQIRLVTPLAGTPADMRASVRL